MTVEAVTVEAVSSDEVTPEGVSSEGVTPEGVTPEAFSRWLDGMADEALAVALVLERADAPEALRWASAEAVSHLLHSLPLIPKGVEALGYLQVLFIWRALAEQAAEREPELVASAEAGIFQRLAADAKLAAEFLGEDAGRLRRGVESGRFAATGSFAPHALLADDEVREQALGQVRAWVAGYVAPEFGDGPEELVKLAAFLRTRLRRLVPDEA